MSTSRAAVRNKDFRFTKKKQKKIKLLFRELFSEHRWTRKEILSFWAFCCSITTELSDEPYEQLEVAHYLHLIGLVKTCSVEVDLVQSMVKVTLVFTERGTKLADLLWGEQCLPPYDLNDGKNRQAFALGQVI